ncbi:MAG: guanylate kinase [Helicobacter sp.]|nr:guanylate kinase [Helicobacteraceae bacterium]MDY3114202.1 guanylate kinase [Helicobacter sp.]
MKSKGAILILSGPSGAGKSSLYKILAQEFKNHYFSISSTTRQKREGEIDGVHYNFINKESFEAGIKNGDFLEWAKVHNNYYGTSKIPVLKALGENKLVIFDIDVQGHAILKKSFSDYITSVFITTPNREILQNRLESRGSDSKEIVQKRLENAKQEMQCLKEYDYLIINENLEESAKTLICIARSAFYKAGLYNKEVFLKAWNLS